MKFMWKTSSPSSASSLVPKHEAPKPEAKEPVEQPIVRPQPTPSPSVVSPTLDGSISKGLIFKGEISGKGALYVDGQLEGSINLPGERVTIGVNGQVIANLTTSMRACITARDIVVLGKVRGDVHATDRVDIRTEGSLVGDVTAARIIISDGAYFKGGIDLQKTQASSATVPAAESSNATKIAAKVFEAPLAALKS